MVSTKYVAHSGKGPELEATTLSCYQHGRLEAAPLAAPDL